VTPVSLREANVGLNYPCCKCSEMFDTSNQVDKHLGEVHNLRWTN
jgi:hypothetical protein